MTNFKGKTEFYSKEIVEENIEELKQKISLEFLDIFKQENNKKNEEMTKDLGVYMKSLINNKRESVENIL